MNILFITSNRLGDAVLSTGALAYIAQEYPQARVTIVCGALPAPLFEGYPLLHELIILKKQTYSRHWLKLWRRVSKTRWDMVIDLRDSAVSRLIWVKKRHINTSRIDRKVHKVEQVAAVMGLDTVPAPCLWPTRMQNDMARTLLSISHNPKTGGDGSGGEGEAEKVEVKAEVKEKVGADPKDKIIAIGPTANWIGKTWPAERFIDVVKALTAPDGLFPEARVAVFAAPGEEEKAYQVLESVPESRRIDVIAKTDPGTAAAALGLCDFYIGNDSGLMHCAAAAGVPTVGLFGPSYDRWYRPWGPHCTFVRTPETFDELIDFEGYDPKTLDHTLMESLSVEAVLTEIKRFWKTL